MLTPDVLGLAGVIFFLIMLNALAQSIGALTWTLNKGIQLLAKGMFNVSCSIGKIIGNLIVKLAVVAAKIILSPTLLLQAIVNACKAMGKKAKVDFHTKEREYQRNKRTNARKATAKETNDQFKTAQETFEAQELELYRRQAMEKAAQARRDEERMLSIPACVRNGTFFIDELGNCKKVSATSIFLSEEEKQIEELEQDEFTSLETSQIAEPAIEPNPELVPEYHSAPIEETFTEQQIPEDIPSPELHSMPDTPISFAEKDSSSQVIPNSLAEQFKQGVLTGVLEESEEEIDIAAEIEKYNPQAVPVNSEALQRTISKF